MTDGTNLRLFRRMPVYSAISAAAFLALFLDYRSSGISPVREPLWQWTALSFAVGCLSPIFGLTAWILADRSKPTAAQWLRGAAISSAVFVISPSGRFLASKVILYTIYLIAGAIGFSLARTIFVVFFVVAWLATAWIFFDVGRAALVRKNAFGNDRVRLGGSIWLIAGILGIVGAVAWLDAGRKPEVWETVDDGAPRGFTYNTAPVSLTLHGVNVTIPRAYIWPWGPPTDSEKRGNMEAINIEAHLPDMQPIQPGNADCFTHQTICHDVAWGFLLAGDPPPVERQYGGRVKMDPDELPTGPFGLHDIVKDDDLLLVEGKLDDEVVTYMCLKSTRTCSFSNGALAPGISYSYQIDESQLDHWAVVHASIRARYRSFVEGAASGR